MLQLCWRDSVLQVTAGTEVAGGPPDARARVPAACHMWQCTCHGTCLMDAQRSCSGGRSMPGSCTASSSELPVAASLLSVVAAARAEMPSSKLLSVVAERWCQAKHSTQSSGVRDSNSPDGCSPHRQEVPSGNTYSSLLSSMHLTCWLAEWEEGLHAGAQQAGVTPQRNPPHPAGQRSAAARTLIYAFAWVLLCMGTHATCREIFRLLHLHEKHFGTGQTSAAAACAMQTRPH